MNAFETPADEAVTLLERQLALWVVESAQAESVSFDRDAEPVDNGVILNLWDIIPGTGEFGGRQLPQLYSTVRYIVLPNAADSEISRRMLASLFVAAMEHPDYAVDPNGPTPAHWQALGMAQRPAFILLAPLSLKRTAAPMRRVMEHPRIEAMALISVQGRVIGPREIPIDRALVTELSSRRRVRTNGAGQFLIHGVAADRPLRLQINARGEQFQQEVAAADVGSEELVIQLQFTNRN